MRRCYWKTEKERRSITSDYPTSEWGLDTWQKYTEKRRGRRKPHNGWKWAPLTKEKLRGRKSGAWQMKWIIKKSKIYKNSLRMLKTNCEDLERLQVGLRSHLDFLLQNAQNAVVKRVQVEWLRRLHLSNRSDPACRACLSAWLEYLWRCGQALHLIGWGSYSPCRLSLSMGWREPFADLGPWPQNSVIANGPLMHYNFLS